MSSEITRRIAYIVTRFNADDVQLAKEIAAHKAAGLEIELFSFEASSPSGEAFTLLPSIVDCADDAWARLKAASQVLPDMWEMLGSASRLHAKVVIPALYLAEETCTRGIQHLHARSAGTAAAVARLAARLSGTTYSFEISQADFRETPYDNDLADIVSEATAVFATSDQCYKHLRSQFTIAAQNVQRVYDGTELSKLSFNTPHERAPLIVATAGQDTNVRDLLEACGTLVKRRCAFRCEIYCEAGQLSRLRTFGDELGLSGHVRFIERSTASQRRELLAKAAVFVVVGGDAADSTIIELLDAMALGTPCLVTDDTPATHFIQDGETGLIEPGHHPKALAISLQRLLIDSSLRVRLAREAYYVIEAKLDQHFNAALQREFFGTAQAAQLS